MVGLSIAAAEFIHIHDVSTPIGGPWLCACGGFGLIVTVVVCALLYNAQSAIPPEHRRIEPGMVWLLLIPLFGLIWNFFVFQRIPESYQSYFYSMGRTDVGDC